MSAGRQSPAGIARDLRKGNALYLHRPEAAHGDEPLRLELERLTGAAVTVKRNGPSLWIEVAKVSVPPLFPVDEHCPEV